MSAGASAPATLGHSACGRTWAGWGGFRVNSQSPPTSLVLGLLPSTELEMRSLKERLEVGLSPHMCRTLLGKMSGRFSMPAVTKRDVLKYSDAA